MARVASGSAASAPRTSAVPTPAAEMVWIDDEPVQVEDSGVDAPGDRAGQRPVEVGAEECLLRRLQVLECLAERRDRVRADQIRLDPVRAALQFQDG
jgi:hypothetical protein